MIHQERTHPHFVEGCPQCRWSTVSVSAMATPTRNGAQSVIRNQRVEDGWDKDHPAYKRLRKDGLQPTRRQGAAELEQRAECAAHVETGMLHVKPRSWEVYHETFGASATVPSIAPVARE